MPTQHDKEIYEDLKSLASKYKIEILTPKVPEYRSKKENDNVVSMHKDDIADNIIGISKSHSSYQHYSLNIVKNRYNCPVTEFIKDNNKEGLKEYLKNLGERVPSIVDVIDYKNKFMNNFIYILKNEKNPQEFLDILEDSQVFQSCKLETDFFITVAFKSDHYGFLCNKCNLKEIIDFPKLQDKIKAFSPVSIIDKLFQYSEFREKMETEFNLLNFVPIMMDNKQLTILEIVLNHIKVEQNLDFKSLFQNFDNMNSLDDKENNTFYFNEAMKVFILHAQYDFTENDKTLDIFTEENKQLIIKNRLNKHLHESLAPKMTVKKAKI